jgi:hypothetical protein
LDLLDNGKKLEKEMRSLELMGKGRKIKEGDEEMREGVWVIELMLGGRERERESINFRQERELISVKV